MLLFRKFSGSLTSVWRKSSIRFWSFNTFSRPGTNCGKGKDQIFLRGLFSNLPVGLIELAVQPGKKNTLQTIHWVDGCLDEGSVNQAEVTTRRFTYEINNNSHSPSALSICWRRKKRYLRFSHCSHYDRDGCGKADHLLRKNIWYHRCSVLKTSFVLGNPSMETTASCPQNKSSRLCSGWIDLNDPYETNLS